MLCQLNFEIHVNPAVHLIYHISLITSFRGSDKQCNKSSFKNCPICQAFLTIVTDIYIYSFSCLPIQFNVSFLAFLKIIFLTYLFQRNLLHQRIPKNSLRPLITYFLCDQHWRLTNFAQKHVNGDKLSLKLNSLNDLKIGNFCI